MHTRYRLARSTVSNDARVARPDASKNGATREYGSTPLLSDLMSEGAMASRMRVTMKPGRPAFARDDAFFRGLDVVF
jgi:hypothetical protein